jgi:hypothetical protein
LRWLESAEDTRGYKCKWGSSATEKGKFSWRAKMKREEDQERKMQDESEYGKRNKVRERR